MNTSTYKSATYDKPLQSSLIGKLTWPSVVPLVKLRVESDLRSNWQQKDQSIKHGACDSGTTGRNCHIDTFWKALV